MKGAAVRRSTTSRTPRLAGRAGAVAAALIIPFAAIGATGCGSSTKTISQTAANGQVVTRTVPNIHFAKTKFALHMGLAFGAFHRYIYAPLKSGALASRASGRVAALLKAGAAALFASHELRLAHLDALADDRLRPLAEKIEALVGRLGGLGSALKGGSLSTQIAGAAESVNALGAASSTRGAPIREVTSSLG